MKISEITALGLWPKSKETTTEKGITELEELGYNLFYIGKNTDLYTCPGNDPKVLLVRSDRCSVFDIPLNLEIEGKGVSQTAISNNGAAFARETGIKTAILSENVDTTLVTFPVNAFFPWIAARWCAQRLRNNIILASKGCLQR